MIKFFTLLFYLLYTSLASGQSLEKIRSDALIKVCTAGGFVPFSSYSNKGWEGFDIDMMKDFAEYLKADIEIINYNIDGIIPALSANKCNLISTGLVITEKRKKSVLFSGSYFKSNVIFLFKNDNKVLNNIKSAAKLNNPLFKIGVKIGTTNDFYATEHLQKSHIFKYNEYGDLVNSVRNNKVDAIIIDSIYGKFIEKKFPGIFRYKNTQAQDQHFAVAARNADKDLVEEFNKFLKEWKSSGKYELVYKKYF
ncbi:substrate-binding periplasmic protein [Fluviispira sanaruensis]|uniref:Amino acid ABC transporter substrate-binding protein n=1 Tax=Fluviispira sanaruensis TaxID=2493639 RepID=A0A4P2VP18_FLUSA|nr:transporter substrate-binding domain-containing protein [Fluviispira sanaruensis]BBH53944.1 amino acid ABC transporter substrate-binding protein [Fluviispira sanaruensis]